MHLNPKEEVLYAFPAQKNSNPWEIFFTNVVVLTNKRILIATKRVVFGYYYTAVTPDKVFNSLTKEMQQTIVDKKVKFYVVDALKVALEVGKVFDTEKSIMAYENLGIGRIIYQLPTPLCEIFLGEVFKKGSLESLDRETLMTVQSFFENNLNVSETSRKLFVHRNTLVYRLEKIRKLTGLDLREFEHAVTFKVALMVKKYLTSKPTKF